LTCTVLIPSRSLKGCQIVAGGRSVAQTTGSELIIIWHPERGARMAGALDQLAPFQGAGDFPLLTEVFASLRPPATLLEPAGSVSPGYCMSRLGSQDHGRANPQSPRFRLTQNRLCNSLAHLKLFRNSVTQAVTYKERA